MVAAVRFRVALEETIDGIYIFAGIAVGLAAGIGYLGISMIMAMVFCFANAIMWQLDVGANPLDEGPSRKEEIQVEQSFQIDHSGNEPRNICHPMET